MKNLINNIEQNSKIMINEKEYNVKTKTWYSIEEDESARYIKCELSDSKVLVVMPDDNFIYVGEIIDDMKYVRLSDTSIKYNDIVFEKTGEGHQYIVNIEFGNEDEIEGRCEFEDFESESYVVSLGFLTDKNIKADIYAKILDIKDIKVV